MRVVMVPPVALEMSRGRVCDVRVEVRGKLPVDCLWEKTTETYAQNST